MPNQNRTARDMFILHSTITSIMIYVECLVMAGFPFETAKRMALDETTWVGDAATHKDSITRAVMGATLSDLSRPAQQMLRESIYFMAIAELGKRDALLRRCVFMWFGLLL